VAEGTFKARAITALSDRLRSELDVLRAQSGEEAERLLTLQAELARRREDIEKALRASRGERGAWEHRIGGMQAATVALEEWVAENEGKVSGADGGADGGAAGGGGKDADIADAAFPPEDAISEQILEEQAKDQALEDAMDYLDEALGAKKIELEPYLEFIRELSKEQFFARATTMVTRKAQRERGRSQGVTF
jgi:ESCRT-I complex subunit TSG101